MSAKYKMSMSSPTTLRVFASINNEFEEHEDSYDIFMGICLLLMATARSLDLTQVELNSCLNAAAQLTRDPAAPRPS